MFDDQSLKECVASDSEWYHAELTRLARYNLQDEFGDTLLTQFDAMDDGDIVFEVYSGSEDDSASAA